MNTRTNLNFNNLIHTHGKHPIFLFSTQNNTNKATLNTCIYMQESCSQIELPYG